MNMTLKLIISLFCITLLTNLIKGDTHYEPNWNSIDSRPLPSWYDESKIGIFLHWGVFSVPSFGSEWFWENWEGSKSKSYIQFMTKNYRPDFSYPDFASQLTTEFYDPSQWADIFEASGAKYVILTSKHHEGFTLWPSKYSFSWNAMDVGPKRDLLGDLADAIRAKPELRFGVYHSWFEWFNPIYLQDKANGYKTQDFVNFKSFPELQELVLKYKPEVVWSDGDWEAPDTYWKSTQFLAWLYNDSPVKDSVVVNDRWGSGDSCKHGGYYTCTDRYNPKVLQKHKWENAMTIDKSSWGYRRNAQLSDYLTTDDLITTLVETVSCGGNLLINVGPTKYGVIIPIFEERLRELGKWLMTNGESIYKTKPWKKQNDTITKGVWYTENSGIVYSIVLEWPQNNTVLLGAIDFRTVDTVQMLGVKGNLIYSSASGGGTSVTFPQLNPSSELQWAWVLKIILKV